MSWILKDTSKQTNLWINNTYSLVAEDYVLSTPIQIKVGDVQHPKSIFGLWSSEDLYNETGFKQLEIVDVSPTPTEYYEKSDTFTDSDTTDYKITRTYSYTEKAVANFLTALLDQVDVIREEKIAQGINWIDETSTNWVVQTDQASIRNLMGIVAGLSAGISLPANFVWRMKSNYLVSVDETSLKEIATVVLNHVNECYSVAWTHKAAIADITTITALNTYSTDTINTLWPDPPA